MTEAKRIASLGLRNAAKPEEERASKLLTVRLTQEQLESVRQMAADEGVSVAELVKVRLGI